MKNNIIYLVVVASAFLFSGCESFLDRPPLGAIGDTKSFWNSQIDVRTYSMQYYASRFNGFGDTNGGGWFFDNRSLCDDFAPTTLPLFQPQTAGAENDAWSSKFNQIRADNVFVNRMMEADMGDAATTNHWLGVARFWRAVDYSNFVLEFGKVPWYDKILTETSPEIYKPRDPITFVMDKVLEDFNFAKANVLANKGVKRQEVNKWVVEGIMARQLLMVGTTIKYNPSSSDADKVRAGVYIQAAKDAAKDLMDNGGFTLSADYQLLFSSPDLASNNEVILFRAYSETTTPFILHNVMFYNLPSTNQNGGNKDLLDSYLKTDGKVYLPGTTDQSAKAYFAQRDPRLAKTFKTDTFYIAGKTPQNVGSSSTGFKSWKFLDIPNQAAPTAQNQKNVTDAPVLRLGEVMLSYIEACVELQDLNLYTVTDNDLEITINKLRGYNAGGRNFGAGVPLLPKLTLATIPNDPNRDSDISPLKWEIRRERRTELVFEGFRLLDLKRWRKLDYMNTTLHPKTNLGAWLVKDMTNSINKTLQVANLDGSIIAGPNVAGTGYLQPAVQPRGAANVNDKYYLNYIPTQEIKRFQDAGFTLDQNPGW